MQHYNDPVHCSKLNKNVKSIDVDERYEEIDLLTKLFRRNNGISNEISEEKGRTEMKLTAEVLMAALRGESWNNWRRNCSLKMAPSK